MGCDIHVVIQVQQHGQWQEVLYQRDWTCIGKLLAPGVPVAPKAFLNRNYDTFGILANVRNGYGFAGVETGTGWKSIAPDRGLPSDLAPDAVLPSPTDPEEGPRWLGDHSFTWITLDELKAYPWEKEHALIYGVVPAETYESLKDTDAIPVEYSGGITGPGIRVYTPEMYEAAKSGGGGVALCERPYVRMRWTETARDASGDWPGTVIPWLEELAQGRPLRLVMGFDS